MTTTTEAPTSSEHDDRDARRIAVEQPVLGALLAATPSYDTVSDVAQVLRGGGDFARPAHGLIYEAVLRLHGRDNPTTPIAVATELERNGSLVRAGGAPYLHKLASLAYPGPSAAYYANQIRGLARLEDFFNTAVRGAQRARTADPEDPDEAIGGHLAEVEQLLAGSLDDDDADFGRFGDSLDEHLDSLEADIAKPFAVTGFEDMDSLMRLEVGQLILAAGRPAMGKSAFALGVATATAATGRPVLFSSLEMNRREVSNRIIAARARVGFHHLKRGKAGMDDDDWSRIGRHLEHLRDLPLWMDYRARNTLGRIRARAKQVTRETGLAPLVVIDYFGLLEPDRSGRRQENRYAEATEMSRELKLMPRELGCTVLALAQLNRGPEQRTDKRPVASDLRDTGALEQDADAVILIHREDAYDKTSSRSGEADLIVAKHRNGPTADITVAAQFHYSRFVDMAQS
ncbi:replicative DNA helicase [Streptacidiphilus sp. PAMC 29251]